MSPRATEKHPDFGNKESVESRRFLGSASVSSTVPESPLGDEQSLLIPTARRAWKAHLTRGTHRRRTTCRITTAATCAPLADTKWSQCGSYLHFARMVPGGMPGRYPYCSILRGRSRTAVVIQPLRVCACSRMSARVYHLLKCRCAAIRIRCPLPMGAMQIARNPGTATPRCSPLLVSYPTRPLRWTAARGPYATCVRRLRGSAASGASSSAQPGHARNTPPIAGWLSQ